MTLYMCHDYQFNPFLVFIQVIKTDMDSKLYEDNQQRAHTISLHPWNSRGRPEDITHAATFLGSEIASWITGAILPVEGGYFAI